MTPLSRRPQAFYYKYLPFQPSEKKKFFAFCFLKAVLSFFFTMVKIQKSNNLVTAHGAEKIPAAKTLVFVLSLFIVVFYTMLSNKYRQDQLFYGILYTFLGFFIIYGFFILPYVDALRPHHATEWLDKYAGSQFFNRWLKYWVILYLNWEKVIFYCMAELWGQFCIIMFFWSLCNELCKKEEAKRFYHFFIAAGCIGSTLGARFLTFLCRKAESQVGMDSVMSEHLVLHKVSSWLSFIGIGVVCLLLVGYRWINTSLFSSEAALKAHKVKTKLSFWEGLKYILSSRYLLAAATMIIACAVSSNLVEITYQRYVKLSGGTPAEYAHFMQWQMFALNMLCIFASFFIIPYVMRYMGWKMVAYIAPLTVMTMGGLFFISSICNKGGALDAFSLHYLGMSSVKAICLLGLLQSVLATFGKYAFFDSTKEIVYIEMGPEGRRKGKAAIDVVGSRMGKTLSSVIHMIIMGLFDAGEDVRKVTPVLLVIFLAVIFAWFKSVNYLSKTLNKKEEVQEVR